MKIINVLKAQKKFNDLTEEIKGIVRLRASITEIYINTNAEGSGKILNQAINQADVVIDELQKKREELEV